MNDGRCYAVMAKPAGGACNLRCDYCYYLPAAVRIGGGFYMSAEVLERYISENLRIHGKDAVVEFAWHGGEPTLRGADFFRRAVEIEKKYGAGRKILNTIQTNGTLIDEEWCTFFAENNFLAGLSIDGPERLHDRYRRGEGGGSFRRALRAAELMRDFGVEFNTLTAVNAENSAYPEELYDFLSGLTDFMQFLPVIERVSGGVLLAPDAGGADRKIAPFSVAPEAWGDFLVRIFERWRAKDAGKKFVQNIEAAVGNMLGSPPGVCLHEMVCGHAASLEADGSLYCCDRFTDAAHRLGNIMEAPLDELMEKNRPFGLRKAETLSDECRACRWLPLCWGGCPKDRFANGKNYLCAGYRRFFTHAASSLRFVKNGARR